MSVALMVILMRGLNWSRLLASNAPIVALYLYFAISVLWSEFPLSSFKRCAKDFGFLLVIAVIWTEKEPLEAMRAVYVRCASVLLPLSVVLFRYFPRWVRAYTVGAS